MLWLRPGGGCAGTRDGSPRHPKIDSCWQQQPCSGGIILVRKGLKREGRPVERHPALRSVILLGTPLTLIILEFFHPMVSRDVAGTLFPVAGWWITLHVVQLVLFALMGAGLWLLTDGLHGIATTVSRLGAAAFVVFYGAGDTLLGIATGILARGANDLPTEVREGRVEAIATIFESPIANLLYLVGELGWLVGLLAAVVAFYAASSPRLPLVLLVLSGCVLLVFDHPAPFGPIVFGLFFVGALWVELTRGRRAVGERPRVA